MSTLTTLQYDMNDSRAVSMLRILLASGLFIEQQPKTGMQEAVDDIRDGRVHEMTSIDDFMKSL